MNAGRPDKDSIALAVWNGAEPGRLLLVRRPEDDAELPGLWGLPAATRRKGETAAATVRRIGRQKLGVRLEPGPLLAEGQQERPAYLLRMQLRAAQIFGGQPDTAAANSDAAAMDAAESAAVTCYTAWRWGRPAELRYAAAQGSLCCQLLLNWQRNGGGGFPLSRE